MDNKFILDFDKSKQVIKIQTYTESDIATFLSIKDSERVSDGVIFTPDPYRFLASEGVCAINEMTEAYREARNNYLSFSPEELEVYDKYYKQTDASIIPLFDYQKEFLVKSFLASNYIANFSEQGTGKTPMMLGQILQMSYNKYIIFTPKKARIQIYKEIVSFFKPIIERVHVLMFRDSWDSKVRRENTSLFTDVANLPENANNIYIIVANHDAIKPCINEFIEFMPRYGFNDESFKTKNPKADITKKFLELRKEIKRPICPMNGTPIGKDVGDFWAQLKLALGSKLTMSYGQWMDNFAVIEMERVSRTVEIPKVVGAKNIDLLFESIYPFYFRATKASCTELLPKAETEYPEIPLYPEQEEIYRNLEEKVYAEDMIPAVRVMRLQQITSGFYVSEAERYNSIYDRLDSDDYIDEDAERDLLPNLSISNYKNYPGIQLLPSSKIDWLKDYISDRKEYNPNIKILVWCRFNVDVYRIYEELVSIGIQTEWITGATKDYDIERIKERINNVRDNLTVTVMQIASMAFAHNMQGGDVNIYYSGHYSPILNQQSEDRTHRVGRKGIVEYLRPQCTIRIKGKQMGTEDHKVNLSLLERKKLSSMVSPGTFIVPFGDKNIS